MVEKAAIREEMGRLAREEAILQKNIPPAWIIAL